MWELFGNDKSRTWKKMDSEEKEISKRNENRNKATIATVIELRFI